MLLIKLRTMALRWSELQMAALAPLTTYSEFIVEDVDDLDDDASVDENEVNSVHFVDDEAIEDNEVASEEEPEDEVVVRSVLLRSTSQTA
jgi:hypothetical protein